MPAYKDHKFSERLDTAAKARKALLEKFKAQPAPDDPAVLERQAARKAAADARDARLAERKAAKDAEAARLAAEQSAKAEEAAVRAAELAARIEAEKAARKAARDARYAARKARR
jgi:hypothetical protein